MKPHYYGHRNRLRKKYLKNGINGLSNYEVLELLLTFSIPVKDVKPLAKELIDKYGNIKEIFKNLNYKEFLRFKGIGEKSFILFKLINDINQLIETEKLVEKDKIKSSIDVLNYSEKILWNKEVEEFWVIFLTSQNEIITSEKISEGIVNEAYVYLRKLFEKAFEYNSTALILIHNHPSGSPSPSKEDINLTKKIVKLAEELGIVVHDHIIIGKNSHFSFRENNIL